MQPQDPFQQPAQPPVQPVQQQMPPEMPPAAAPAVQPVPMTAANDPGKTLSLVGVILAILMPIVGIILGAIGRSKSKAAGFSGKLGLVAIILGIAVTVLSILGFVLVFVFAVTSGDELLKSSASSTGSSLNSEGIDVDKQADKEAFGVKVGMNRSDVEKVLGQPQTASAYSKACNEIPASSAGALGYDTTCTYQVGTAQEGSYVIPAISVKYLDEKLVDATKTDADGTITTLNKDGVTTIKQSS